MISESPESSSVKCGPTAAGALRWICNCFSYRVIILRFAKRTRNAERGLVRIIKRDYRVCAAKFELYYVYHFNKRNVRFNSGIDSSSWRISGPCGVGLSDQVTAFWARGGGERVPLLEREITFAIFDQSKRNQLWFRLFVCFDIFGSKWLFNRFIFIS